jgi:ATP-binding cassette subfamily C protein CydC
VTRRASARPPRRDPLVRAVAALDPSPWRILVAVLAGTAALGSAVGLMTTSAWLISRASQHPPIIVLQLAIVATRAFGTSRGVLRYVERLTSHDVALRGVGRIREALYGGLATADPAVVAGLRRGDLLARVGGDVDVLADLVVRCLLPFAVAITTAAASTAVVAVLAPGAGLAAGTGLAVAVLAAASLAGLAARRAERQAADARGALGAEVLTLLDGVGELTVAGAVPARLARLVELDESLARRLERASGPAAGAAACAVAATGLAVVAVLALGARAVVAGGLDPVLLAVITLAPLATAEAVIALPAAARSLVRARAAAERVCGLLDAGAAPAPSDRAPSDRAPSGPASRPPAPIPSPVLRATGLACGWPGSAPALTGIDLTCSAGRRIAVVGPSGCGKTTLLLTLAGLIPPAAGRLTCAPAGGGRAADLPAIDQEVLRSTVSFTAEDAHIFTTTVRENLRLARPGAPDPELRSALARAGLGRWLAGLPDGLDTSLGSGGAGLSQGERRRLLLARSFLVGAGILLLDEPAEHLGPDIADALVRAVLTSSTRGAGVVVATHRLAPLDAADEVIVLRPGETPARGTHDWLLRHDLTYRDAWHAERGTEEVVPAEAAGSPGG